MAAAVLQLSILILLIHFALSVSCRAKCNRIQTVWRCENTNRKECSLYIFPPSNRTTHLHFDILNAKVNLKNLPGVRTVQVKHFTGGFEDHCTYLMSPSKPVEISSTTCVSVWVNVFYTGPNKNIAFLVK